MPILVEADLTDEVVGIFSVAERLMSMLVEAGLTHQVVPCIHTVVVFVVKGERGGACLTWEFKVVFQ